MVVGHDQDEGQLVVYPEKKERHPMVVEVRELTAERLLHNQLGEISPRLMGN